MALSHKMFGGRLSRPARPFLCVVLMDLLAPGWAWIEASGRIRNASPVTRVMLHTVDESGLGMQQFQEAMTQGLVPDCVTDCYVLQSISPDEIVRAVWTAER